MGFSERTAPGADSTIRCYDLIPYPFAVFENKWWAILMLMRWVLKQLLRQRLHEQKDARFVAANSLLSIMLSIRRVFLSFDSLMQIRQRWWPLTQLGYSNSITVWIFDFRYMITIFLLSKGHYYLYTSILTSFVYLMNIFILQPRYNQALRIIFF